MATPGWVQFRKTNPILVIPKPRMGSTGKGWSQPCRRCLSASGQGSQSQDCNPAGCSPALRSSLGFAEKLYNTIGGVLETTSTRMEYSAKKCVGSDEA